MAYEPSEQAFDREAHIANLLESYQYQCQDICKELIQRQQKWQKELYDDVPGSLSILNLRPGAEEANADHQNGQRALGKQSSQAILTDDEDFPLHSYVSADSQARTKLPWLKTEVEAHRKAVLMFGVRRNEDIYSYMQSSLRGTKIGPGDTLDASWHFLKQVCCGPHGDPKVGPWADQMLADLADQFHADVSDDVAQRVSQSEKLGEPISIRLWSRKLRMLDHLTTLMSPSFLPLLTAELANPSLRRPDDSLPVPPSRGDQSQERSPATRLAWSEDCDLALLVGIFRYGYGSYDRIKRDAELAPKFRSFLGDGHIWPDAYALTRRVKRLMDHLSSLLKKSSGTPAASAVPAAPPSARKPKEDKWLKKDRLELVKVIMTWGLCTSTAGASGSLSLDSIRERSKFRGVVSRGDQSLEGAILDLVWEAQKVTAGAKTLGKEEKGGKPKMVNHPSYCTCLVCRTRKKAQARPHPESPGDPFKSLVFTPITAVRLLERLNLLEVLRWSLATQARQDWALLGLSLTKGHDLLSAWVPGDHDKALVKGVLKHGFASWQAILDDPALPFAQLLATSAPPAVQRLSMDAASSAADEAGEEMGQWEGANEDDDPTGFGMSEGDWAGLEAPAGQEAAPALGPDAWKGVQGGQVAGKALVKRLKFVEKVFRKLLFKKRTLKRKAGETAPGQEAAQDEPAV